MAAMRLLVGAMLAGANGRRAISRSSGAAVRWGGMAVRVRVVGIVVALVAAVVLFWPRGGRRVSRPVADGFDFPVGAPDGEGYYDAQPFGDNTHLGNDWNGVGGGNSDLGDPVAVIADGVVRFAEDVGGGWGNVVRIEHRVRDVDGERSVESLYAHLDRIEVAVGRRVRRGDRVGTIGDAHGQYKAHLHLELRAQTGLPLGGGYASDSTGYLDPTMFIRAHRPR